MFCHQDAVAFFQIAAYHFFKPHPCIFALEGPEGAQRQDNHSEQSYPYFPFRTDEVDIHRRDAQKDLLKPGQAAELYHFEDIGPSSAFPGWNGLA